MNRMIRKQIYLRSDQQKLLALRAHEEDTSEAELIRQALDQLLAAHTMGESATRGVRAKTKKRHAQGLAAVIEAAEANHAQGAAQQKSRKWSRDDFYSERTDKILKHHGRNSG